MGKNVTRRHLLKFMGGSAAGLLLTPIPWKTLDDVAIWTQNWSWIPRPPKGEISTRFTACTLCPAGCGVRARCVAGRPVSLSGVAGHPAGGALCPVGLGGHHLPYHPLRLLQPARLNRDNRDARPVPVSLNEALAAIVKVAEETRSGGAAGESVAVLDCRPGRTLSTIYRKFTGSIRNGLYIAPPNASGIGSDSWQGMLLAPWGQPGLDLENTATLLSFGAPVLDGWSSPGRVTGTVLGKRDSRKMKLIQVEARRSRTAAAADLWVPVNPGTEAALALGVAHVLVRLKMYDEKSVREKAVDFDGEDGSSYLSLIDRFTPEAASKITGVSPARISEIARELALGAPSAVVGGGDPAGGPLGEEEERAIWGLNLLLGSVGKSGGFIPKREAPGDPAVSSDGMAAVSRIEDVPDRSVRLLIVDSTRPGDAIPWSMVERKLVPERALVVSMAPVLAGDARHADLVIPTPACTETLDEVTEWPGSPVATLSFAQSLLPAPAGVAEPAEIIGRMAAALSVSLFAAGESGALSDCLRRRVTAIHKSGRGSVFSPQDGRRTGIAEVDSPDKLWKMLSEGCCWIDSLDAPPPLPRYSLVGREKDAFASMATAGAGRISAEQVDAIAYPLILMPAGVRGAIDDSHVSPLMTKLYQESGLRRLQNQADINPATARAFGLEDRGGAVVETPSGSIRVEIRFDPGVMPGVIHVAVGPGGDANGSHGKRDRQSILTICADGSSSVWRVMRARIREA